MASKAVRLVAVATFTTEVAGAVVLLHAGDAVSSSNPIVKGRESLFAPLTEPTTA
jgi:hypothetical protein